MARLLLFVRPRIRVNNGINHLAFHPGASSVPGVGILHITGTTIDGQELAARWNLLHTKGLAGPELRPEYNEDGTFRAYGSVARVVPLTLIKELMTAPLRRLSRDAFAKTLDEYRLRMGFFQDSFGHYEGHARRKGWVYQVDMFDATPVHIFGIGRYTRVVVLNIDEDAKAPIVFAGRDKAFCRALLASDGLPVASGAVAKSVPAAISAARQVGYPVVLKGISSGDSEDVLTKIRDDRNCAAGAGRLLRENRVLIVEKMVAGYEYRLHFINGRLHAVFRCEALKVVGDGCLSLIQLMQQHYAEYLEVMLSRTAGRRRLVNLTWFLGVRRPEDLAHIRPANGEEVSISPATGHGVMTPCRKTSIRREDRRDLERFLGKFGSPSAGIDLVLPTPAGRLRDGGAIFEVNAPCGFSFLPRPRRAAGLELDGMVARTPGFAQTGGRVPVWLAAKDSFSRVVCARLARCFRSSHPDGKVIEVLPGNRWSALLSDRTAEAFLVLTTEEAISELGIPANLRPTGFHTGTAGDFRRKYPDLCATLKNAGGALRRSDSLW